MRIPSGTTDQYIYFYAVDATDFTTPETGLSSFTVYRSRNGAAAAAFTTPTINETDSSNMAGVYELLLDEDMTIDAGDDEQEMVFHISHAGMAPVVRTITLFRPKITAGNTLGVAADGDVSGNVDGAVASVTAGVTLAAGAVTDASLAGNMEIVFETDFATNYNTTRNAWATNAQDFVGTSAADPFNGQVVAASVTGAVGSISGVTFPTNFADLSITVTTGLVDITQAAADKAWGTAARTLTAATNITSTGGTTVPQTGDTFALANGATGFVAIDTVVDAILLDTAEIGTAGVGLTNVGGSANNWSTHAAGDVWAVDATTQQTQGTFGQAIGDPVADTTTIYQAVATDATGDNVSVDVVALKAETALIVADTAELQGNQGDWATAVGFATPTNITAGTITTVSGNVDGNVSGTVTLANGAHGGAAASITLADYSDFTGAAAANPNVLQSGTITVTDQTNFVLNAGSADDDAYLNMVCVIEDAATATQKSVRTITAYVGATKTVTIDSAPDFTIVSTDKFDILAVAPGSTPPTAAAVADAVWDEASAGHTDAGKAGAQLWTDIDAILVDTNSLNDTKVPQTLNLTASGNIGIDWANVENPTTAVDLSATDIQLCDTVTTLTTLPTIPANWLTAAGTHADFGTEIGAAVLSALGTGSWITAASLVSTGLDAVTAWTVDITGDITTVGSVTTKTGYSLANTGADLILKDSTFALAIADAVWDEPLALHTTADTSGLLLNEWQDGGRLDLILDAILVDTDVTIPGTITTMQGNVTDILADTNELQADDIPTTLATLATTAELDKVPKSDGTVTWNATALASINAEVDTALVTTTYAEPGQGTPAATASLKDKIGYLYKGWRNRSNQTATTYQLFNDDAVTVDQKATVSDDATTAEKGEVATGP